MTVRLRGEAPEPDLAGLDRREERRGRAARGSHARRSRAAPARPAGLAGQTPQPERRSGKADIDRSNGRTGVLGRRFVVVDLDAELRSVAKHRLELGGDRRVIGAGESGRGKRRRRRGGEKLNDEREARRGTRSAASAARRAPRSRDVPRSGRPEFMRAILGQYAAHRQDRRAGQQRQAANIMRLGG